MRRRQRIGRLLRHVLFVACVALVVGLAALNVLAWQGKLVDEDDRAGQGSTVALTPQVGRDANVLPSQNTP
jgi:hypothetical protein